MAHGPSRRSVRCRIITISDTRTAADDHSGSLLRTWLQAKGHRVVASAIVEDSVEAIQTAIGEGLADPETEVVIATGGTGVAPRDVTPEAVAPLLDKPLPGFGELFRSLSYAEVGAAAYLSRALAGCAGSTLVYCLPGSFNAVRLAVDKLILPQVSHLVELLRP